jgi:hypothetical protein
LIRAGTLSEARIDESIRRIEALKGRLGAAGSSLSAKEKAPG